VTIKITPNDKGNPPGKLADAELHFGDGPLEGLKLIGFSIWDRRGGNGRNVTFPRASTASTASGAVSHCCGRSWTRRRKASCVSSFSRRFRNTRSVRRLRVDER
jgi:hypothetical protein